MSNPYHCPLCGRKMERNLALFLGHAEVHVMDQIKKEHPEWVAEDGACRPCADYYRSQLRGESGEENIGPRGRRKRFVMGMALLVLTAVLIPAVLSAGLGRPWRLVLFLPAFFGMLCVIQARQKTCALLAVRGLRDMDGGEGKVRDAGIARRLRDRGRTILIQSAVAALVVTALAFIFS